jgi:hypothetical protein
VAVSATGRLRSLEQTRAELAARLRDRLPELERVIAARVYAISEPRETVDPEYLLGLRTSLATALGYALTAIELGEKRTPPVPTSLLAQARLAARTGVGLDTVLRRYFAGYSLLSELLIGEVDDSGVLTEVSLQQVLRGQSAIFDRLIGAVSEEHVRETESRPSNPAERRSECVRRLLAGEPIDHSELGYDLDAHHLALIVEGHGGRERLRELATLLDRRLLIVSHGGDAAAWACWLGGRRPLASEQTMRALCDTCLDGLVVSVGEPAAGLGGWRLTHRQAIAALPIAQRASHRVVRYADVALLAAILGDDLLATSLHHLYLKPLEAERDGGKLARCTLQAYFRCGRRVSSTAAALGVNRNTVTSRLRSIEVTIGRPLDAIPTELEAVLEASDLDANRVSANPGVHHA